MSIFTVEHTPADIVKVFPKASDIFRTYNINFCCGGDKSLEQIYRMNELNGDDILAQLNESYEIWQLNGKEHFNDKHISLPEMIEQLRVQYSNNVKTEMLQIDPFITRVYQVHGSNQPHLQKMYDLFYSLKDTLEKYVVKEEATVLLEIKKFDSEQTAILSVEMKTHLDKLINERKKVESTLFQIREVTNEFTPPTYACGTYRVTYARLQELEEQIYVFFDLDTALYNRLYNVEV